MKKLKKKQRSKKKRKRKPEEQQKCDGRGGTVEETDMSKEFTVQ